MRVKFGNHIDLCKSIRQLGGSHLLLITTMFNDVYTVDCGGRETATQMINKALVDGYIDVSDFGYSNTSI